MPGRNSNAWTQTPVSSKIGSVVQLLGCLGQLLLRAFRVASRRVQGFMPQQLRQPHKSIPIVSKELVRHRVPQQVGVQLDAGEGAVLVAKGTNASGKKRGHRTLFNHPLERWDLKFPGKNQAKLLRMEQVKCRYYKPSQPSSG